MTIEELDVERTRCYREYQDNLRRINRQYAESNNTVSVGDLIRDHIGFIRVEKFAIYAGKTPCCIYIGTQCKANGDPYKNNKEREVYQTNLVSNAGKKA